MKHIKTLEQLFEHFKPETNIHGLASGITEIARLINSNYRTVYNWKRFSHIPEKYWLRLNKIGVTESVIAAVNRDLEKGG